MEDGTMVDCGREIKSIHIHTLMLEHGPNICVFMVSGCGIGGVCGHYIIVYFLVIHSYLEEMSFDS